MEQGFDSVPQFLKFTLTPCMKYMSQLRLEPIQGSHDESSIHVEAGGLTHTRISGRHKSLDRICHFHALHTPQHGVLAFICF
jgi:hypothetical protein